MQYNTKIFTTDLFTYPFLGSLVLSHITNLPWPGWNIFALRKYQLNKIFPCVQSMAMQLSPLCLIRIWTMMQEFICLVLPCCCQTKLSCLCHVTDLSMWIRYSKAIWTRYNKEDEERDGNQSASMSGPEMSLLSLSSATQWIACRYHLIESQAWIALQAYFSWFLHSEI